MEDDEELLDFSEKSIWTSLLVRLDQSVLCMPLEDDTLQDIIP
jgi:hypothetical protein